MALGYPALMPSAPTSSVLARLRASTRLAAFVLLVFALKIGTVAACANHDYGQIDFGEAGHPVASASIDDTPAEKGPLSTHSGSCTHCQCHHSVAILSQPFNALAVLAPALAIAGGPPVLFADRRRDLRPPIA